MLPAILFDRNLPQTFIGDIPGSRADTLAPTTQKVLGVKAETDIRTATQNASRVWYIIFQRAVDDYEKNEQTHPDIEYLDSYYTLESSESWDELQVYLYTQKP